MSVLDRSALEDSPLADLHAIASELAIDGYRRLRRADLIDSILTHQGGEDAAAGGPDAAAGGSYAGGAGSSDAAAGGSDAGGAGGSDAGGAGGSEAADAPESKDDQPSRRRRGRRGGRGRTGSRDDADAGGEDGDAERTDADEARTAPAPRAAAPKEEEPAAAEAAIVEGVVELLPNGSGFLRISPPDPSDDDVYISAAQVKRCELLSGDRISGPPRAPRRSERFPSLVRVDTINGRPAGEVAEGSRFDDLPSAFPDERLRLGSEDPTVKAIEWLTPFGKGSRVTIAGASRSGKTEALRRLAGSLAEHSELQVSVVLAGVRPEELADWAEGPIQPVAAVSFAASPDVQAHVVEPVVDTARRLAGRGGDVVLLIDTLDGLAPLAARKAMAAARNIVDGGSLTVIATASEPLGGETTVIALDVALTSTGRFPAIDLLHSGTIRPERLVGEAAAEAIARARIEAAEES
ncbi:MAG TPA: Rho termination factor N-terminal domain-containing protein [Solirubrobacteraceae bacterium]|nr:Rho termination factor N-terminal domain-containing protein [Solirubrobacteraceae bacterium]